MNSTKPNHKSFTNEFFSARFYNMLTAETTGPRPFLPSPLPSEKRGQHDKEMRGTNIFSRFFFWDFWGIKLVLKQHEPTTDRLLYDIVYVYNNIRIMNHVSLSRRGTATKCWRRKLNQVHFPGGLNSSRGLIQGNEQHSKTIKTQCHKSVLKNIISWTVPSGKLT